MTHRLFQKLVKHSLMAMAAVVVSLAISFPARALISIEPRSTNAAVADEQRFLQYYQAEQSYQKKLKVGRDRYLQKQINRDKIIAGMSSQLQLREQTVVNQTAAADDSGQPLSWFLPSLAFAGLAAGFVGFRHYLYHQPTPDQASQEQDAEREPEPPTVERNLAAETFFCKGADANARGLYTKEGFLVLKGSIGRKHNAPSVVGTSTEPLLVQLLDSGIIRQEGSMVIFEKDHLFPTPSMAAATLMGVTANGWLEWRTEDGITLDTAERLQPRE